jgi:glycosyltransferase involved in cell wall biosynthesis
MTSDTPLVSVMVPCYNAAPTLRWALASLLAQTHENWECLFVDDGSTDESSEVARSINDPRIRYFRFDCNRGRGAARQYALEKARGAYLCMLDADDWIYPDKLARQIELLKQEPRVVAVSSSMAITRGNQLIGVRRRISRRTRSGWAVIPIKRPGPPPLNWAPSMIRMEIAKAGHFDPKFRSAEDFDFMVRAFLGREVGIESGITYAYSEFYSVTPKKILDGFRYSRRTYRTLNETFPLIARARAVESQWKAACYKLAIALHSEQLFVAARSSRPSEQDLHEFAVAAEAVRAFATPSSDVRSPRCRVSSESQGRTLGHPDTLNGAPSNDRTFLTSAPRPNNRQNGA